MSGVFLWSQNLSTIDKIPLPAKITRLEGNQDGTGRMVDSQENIGKGSGSPLNTRRPRPSPTLALAEEIEQARREGQNVLSLSTPSFPPLALPNISTSGLNGLSPAKGDPGLRAAAAQSLFGRWHLEKHEVLVTAGAKAAIFAALAGLLPSGSTVIVIAPAWPSYADIVRLAGHRAVLFETLAEDAFRIDGARLQRMAKAEGARAVILSNPCNPTGRIHTSDELEAVMATIEEIDGLMLLDESFSEIVFSPAAWREAVVPESRRLVVFNSFSKNYWLQGLRVAACIIHERLSSALTATHQTLISSAPSLSQAAALAATRSGGPGAAAYEASRAIAADIVARAGWNCVPGAGSFYLFPWVADLQPALARMRAAGLFALAGDAFGRRYANHFRLCFGKPEAEMEAIRQRLQEAGLLAEGR